MAPELKPVADAIKDADSSVLFAIMDVGAGTGPVLDETRRLPKRRGLYAFGTTQRRSGALKVRASGRPNTFIPFNYLRAKTPLPFRPEIAGGAGQVSHHKFVVVDFNDTDPVVYCGSSNLAARGEQDNGDNLIALHDRNIATTYAVEAMRLLDHYRFRAAMKTSSSSQRSASSDATSAGPTTTSTSETCASSSCCSCAGQFARVAVVSAGATSPDGRQC